MTAALSPDQLVTVRRAVAAEQRRSGVAHLADRTEAGEMDTTPLMQAAIAAVAAILKELFE